MPDLVPGYPYLGVGFNGFGSYDESAKMLPLFDTSVPGFNQWTNPATNEVYTLPEKVDQDIAKLKLKSMGVGIDNLTKEQKIYLASWTMGT